MNAKVANRAHTLGIEVEPGDYGYARLEIGDIDGALEWHYAQHDAGMSAYYAGELRANYRPLAWRNGWDAAAEIANSGLFAAADSEAATVALAYDRHWSDKEG